MSKKNSGFLLGAIIGGAIAATTALLLAPKSGDKMREDLLNQLDEASEGKASDYLKYAQEKGSEFGELVKEKKEEHLDSLNAIAFGVQEDVVVPLTEELQEASLKVEPTIELNGEALAEDINEVIQENK